MWKYKVNLLVLALLFIWLTTFKPTHTQSTQPQQPQQPQTTQSNSPSGSSGSSGSSSGSTSGGQNNKEILKQLPLQTIQPNSLFSVIDGALKAQMAQSDDSLFVVDISSTLLAYAKKDGSLIWQATINQSSVISTSPYYDAGSSSVYWVGQDMAMHSFDAATGTINWNSTMAMQMEQYNPIAAGGVVGCIDYSIQYNVTMFIGYSATDGSIVYQQPVGENYTVPQLYKGQAVFAINPWTERDGEARPDGSKLTVIDIATGKVNLNQTVPFTITSPILWVADDEIYFGASDGIQNTYLVRYDVRVGNATWLYNLSPNTRQYFKPSLDSMPIVRDDFNAIYVPTRQGFLYAIDRTLGTQMWNISQPNMTQPMGTTPVMFDYNIAIPSDKRDIYIVNVNLTTVQYVIQTTEQVLNVLSDKSTLYYFDQSGTCGSAPIEADLDFYPMFENIHPYYDLSKVELALSSGVKEQDNFTSAYAFDIYWNQTQIAIGFSKLYPMTVTNPKLDDKLEEHLYWGGTDFKLYDNANIQNYTQYNNFNRTFNSFIIAGPGINQANQTVYAASMDNTLYAVTATNEQVWSFATNGPIICDPYYVNDTVYVASSDGYVYSINSRVSKGQNITVNWQKSVGNWTISKPFIYQGLLYVATTAGDIYAIDTSNGIGEKIATFPDIIYANGAVDYAGWLYYADKGGLVKRLSRTGDTSWQVKLDGAVLGGVLVVNDTVSVVTTGGTLYALNRLTGKEQWKYEGLGASFVQPVNYKETFYVGSMDGWIWAINSTDKTILNTLQLDNNITSISTTENFAREKLLFVATSKVNKLSGGGISVDPTVNSTVYALQPPGATKKYVPQMYVGPIIPQPEDYLVGGGWPNQDILGIDSITVPEINTRSGLERFQIKSTLYTRNCIACNQALGQDLGKWMSQIMLQNDRWTVFDQIECPPVSKCNQVSANGRRIKQNSFSMDVTQYFNSTQIKSPSDFNLLNNHGNQISESTVMSNYYGAQNYKLNSAGPTPVDSPWIRHKRQIIPVIVVVGTVLIVILFSWLFCCRFSKPRDPTVKARVADQGTFESYRTGTKDTQLNTRKPLLYSTKNDINTNTRTTPTQLETSDVYEKDENDQEYDDDSRDNKIEDQKQPKV